MHAWKDTRRRTPICFHVWQSVWQPDKGSVWNPLANPLMSSDIGNQAMSSTWQVKGQVSSSFMVSILSTKPDIEPVSEWEKRGVLLYSSSTLWHITFPLFIVTQPWCGFGCSLPSETQTTSRNKKWKEFPRTSRDSELTYSKVDLNALLRNDTAGASTCGVYALWLKCFTFTFSPDRHTFKLISTLNRLWKCELKMKM